MTDYYAVLEVDLDASQEQIKDQYRFLVQAWHPDKFASPESKSRAEEKLKKINEAYAVLKDSAKREQFDWQQKSQKLGDELQSAIEIEMRAHQARAAAQAREEQAQRSFEQKRRAEQVAQELLQKLAEELAQRENTLRKNRAFSIQLAPGVVMEFIRVPAGQFLMGSDTFKDPAAYKDEKPQRSVFLSEFLIGQFPVTNRQYQAFLQGSQHHAPVHWQTDRAILSTQENHPVVNLNWLDATAFCGWLCQLIGMKVRLPSEAEWEKAARGSDGRIYPWGNQLPTAELAGFNRNETGPVGSYPKGISPYGALDMSGNVWEWVNDFYNKNYYQLAPSSNPPGPVWGEHRVLRGGSYKSSADLIRNAGRSWGPPSGTAQNDQGFRCAISL